jgi:hypothetical protein
VLRRVSASVGLLGGRGEADFVSDCISLNFFHGDAIIFNSMPAMLSTLTLGN